MSGYETVNRFCRERPKTAGQIMAEIRDKHQDGLTLDSEWSQQVEAYLLLGYHKALRMKEQEYAASLPQIYPQPEQFKGRFDIPVIVDPRLHWSEQCKLTAVFIMPNMECQRGKTRNWGKWRTPETPYIAWMHDGQRNMGKSVEEVRGGLAFDERGATLLEGLGLIIARPNILYKSWERPDQIVLPGTSVFYTYEIGFRHYEKRIDVPRISCSGEKSLDHILTEPYWSHGSVTCGLLKSNRK